MSRLQQLPRAGQPAPGRQAQEIGRIGATPRERGRPWQRRRDRWLQEHPLCAECQQERPPRVSAGQVVDHRVPLWAGGPDDGTNLQSMCHHHHDAKSACEARMRAAGGWRAAPCSCGQHR